MRSQRLLYKSSQPPGKRTFHLLLSIIVMKTTLVSALFYIQDCYLEKRHTRYRDWLKNVLSLDAPLVMQTDAHYYQFIQEQRRLYDPEFQQTRLILTSLPELDCYRQFHESIARLAGHPRLKARCGRSPYM